MRRLDKIKLAFHDWIISVLRKQLQKHNEKKKVVEKVPTPFPFKSLAPYEQSDDNNVYCDALQSAFEEDGIYNIGLTGNYGSGKSSVLKTFQKKYENDYNFLNISLATFLPSKVESDQDKNGHDPIIQQLELSILQQILYVEKPKYLRFTRINRIKKFPKWKLWLFAVLTALWVHSLIFILKPGFLDSSKIWGLFSWDNYKTEFVSVSWLVFGIGIVFLVYRILWTIRGANINRFKFSEGEIELRRDVDHSIINKNLDEILYFFEETSYDTVVIEDLDRFNNEGIFAKLRELNTILNNSSQVNRKIRFVYAVKDDLFEKIKNRTKFFDLIIPVVPVVNNTNSGNKLYEWFKEVGYEDRLKRNFLLDISYYIDDMRLIKNIFNEFLIYEKVIGKDLNTDKLLGMIVYKNLYPDQFGLLHEGKGELVKLIRSKKGYTQGKIDNYQDKKLQETASFPKDAEYMDQEELRTISTSIRTRVRALENKIREEKSWSISRILRQEQRAFEEFSKVKLTPLTTYLLKNEYIDENFENYISYFYSGIFNSKETELIQGIRTQQSPKYHLEVENHSEVISKIDVSHFRRTESLNISILDYILSNKERYDVQLEATLSQALNNGQEFRKFLLIYLQKGVQLNQLLASLSVIWHDMWHYIANSREINNELKNTLLIALVKNLSISELTNQNKNGSVQKSLEFKHDLLSIWPEDFNDKLIEAANSLEVKFKKLRQPVSNPELLNQIFTNNLYRLDSEMIEFMFVHELGETNNNKDLLESHLTTILGSGSVHLTGYVRDNIKAFLKDHYLNLKKDQSESQEVFLEILELEDINTSLKSSFISKNKTQVTNSVSVTSDVLTKQLFKEGKIIHKWDSIRDYYELFGQIEKELIEFYKKSYTNLSKYSVSKWEDDEDNEIHNKICYDIIYCNALPNDVYVKLLSSIHYYYHELDFAKISEEHINSLIVSRKVRLSSRNCVELRRHHPNNLYKIFIHALHGEIQSYVEENEKALGIAAEDYLRIIKSKLTNEKRKLLLFDTMKSDDLEGQTDLSNELINFLTRCNSYKSKFSLILKIINESSLLEEKLEFILHYLKRNPLSQKRILELLKASGKPFSAANIRGGGSFKVENNDVNKSLCILLRKKGIISSYSVNSGQNEIKVNRKLKLD